MTAMVPITIVLTVIGGAALRTLDARGVRWVMEEGPVREAVASRVTEVEAPAAYASGSSEQTTVQTAPVASKGGPVASECVECRHQIPRAALKCKDCGAYQNWTRYVLRWSSLAVALIALFPLWNIMLSLWRIATPPRPEVELFALRCTREEIKVAISNGGPNAVIVAQSSFAVRRVPEPIENRDARALVGFEFEGAVKGDQLIVATYKPDMTAAGDLPAKNGSTECRYEVGFTVTLAARAPAKKGISCDCPP